VESAPLNAAKFAAGQIYAKRDHFKTLEVWQEYPPRHTKRREIYKNQNLAFLKQLPIDFI
jgi:hypothetical protein